MPGTPARAQVYVFSPVVQIGDATELGSPLERDLRVHRLLPTGEALFTCDVVDGRKGLWFAGLTGRRLVAAEKDPLPQFGPDAVLASMRTNASIADDGTVQFYAGIVGVPTPSQGPWLAPLDGDPFPIALTDDPVPTMPGASIRAVGASGINSSGQCSVSITAEQPGVPDLDLVFRSESDGTLTRVVGEGDPTGRSGETFASLRWSGIDEAGNVYVQGYATGVGAATGIWKIDPAGDIEKIVRAQDDVPDLPPISRFHIIDAPVMTPGGDLVFVASLFLGSGITGDNNEGIWMYRNGGIELLVREGDPVPGLPEGTVFVDVDSALLTSRSDGAFDLSVDVDGPSISHSDRHTFWYVTADGELAFMYRNGDPVPELGPEYEVNHVSLGQIEDDGSVLIDMPFLSGPGFKGAVVRRTTGGTTEVVIQSGLSPWTAVGVPAVAISNTNTVSYSAFSAPGTLYLSARLETDEYEQVIWYGTYDPDHCFADVNRDGLVTPMDFNAWVMSYNEGLASCDQNGDGACTPADFNGWILNYNAGC